MRALTGLNFRNFYPLDLLRKFQFLSSTRTALGIVREPGAGEVIMADFILFVY